MLQQTQVQTVIPYWRRWMKVLPDVPSLARARLDAVLKLWEGLGYYTRARNLHAAAQVIVARHEGRFPEEYDAMLALPGIGRYTAGAICSIAFNEPTPILDGNVVRVLSRVYGIRDNTRLPKTNGRLWEEAERLVQLAGQLKTDGRTCSALNQALMELGAMVCTPKAPTCNVCPLQNCCVAKKTGFVDRLPNIAKRPSATARHFAAFVVGRGDRVLVRQRPGGVVNAHLWEFPNFELTGASGASRELAAKRLGCQPKSLKLLCTIRHSITRFRIRLDVYETAAATTLSGRWCTRGELEQLAFPSAHRRIIEGLSE
jgi:A/G-specific adenine glycosylase